MNDFEYQRISEIEFKKLFHGTLYLEKLEQYLIPRRFSVEQMRELENNQWFHDRMRCSASVTIEFVTNAEKIAFAYKFFLRTGIKSTFEVYTDGFLTHLVEDHQLNDEGVLEFSFGEGRKRIEIYLPNYSEVGIKDLCLNGECSPVVSKGNKVLFFGDSITQGGGSERSGLTYVNVVKRALNYEILNQGIGGYYCDKNSLKKLSFQPNMIIVAFGTNHRKFSELEHKNIIKEYFEELNKLYGEIPILMVLPPYCGDGDFISLKNTYKRIKKDFLNEVALYKNIKVVSAYHMIPHLQDYYMSDFLHPNSLGMMEYGNNLVEAIRKTFEL